MAGTTAGPAAGPAKVMNVFTIIQKEGYDKSFWVKVGACFTNRDGSLNVFLDALPVNGKLQIRARDDDSGGQD